jgi:formylglycine-generating enzyme required for sulfatase activity
MKQKSLFLFSIFFISAFMGIFSFAQAQTLDPKKLEKRMAKIDSTLYADKFEITNYEYQEFLLWAKNTAPDIYKESKVDTAAWNMLKGMELIRENYHSHENFAQYPVVNISFDAANYFCKWLTDVYNASPKKKFQKVTFRLPTELEWEKAAKGGQKDSIVYYAWKGIDVTDKHNNYLCNFQDFTSVKGGESADHYIITAPVNSYPPNGYGLYNMCGNAAEMINEEGITKGGSWDSKREYLRISYSEYYTKVQPYIGFRVFMQVDVP